MALDPLAPLPPSLRPTCFTDLPNELLLITAHHLTEERDLFSLLLTSRRFAFLLSTTLYRTHIRNTPADTSPRALHWACEHGNLRVVRILLHLGADAHCPPPPESHIKRHLHPLHRAAKGGHLAVVEELLRGGVKPDIRTSRCINVWPGFIDGGLTGRGLTQSYESWTSLHFAAQRGHVCIIRLLISRGAIIDEEDNGVAAGISPLCLAALNGREQAVALLLDHGCAINRPIPGGLTALHAAAMNGHAPIVSLLLSRGANKDAVTAFNMTPLYKAAENGHPEVAKVLLENFANPRISNRQGSSPLHRAAASGSYVIADLLLRHGADVGALNARQETPLHWAAGLGYEGVVRLLLNHGADVNVRNIYGLSALIYAADWPVKPRPEVVVRLLLRAGARKDIVTKKGMTAWDCASFRGHEKAAKLLRCESDVGRWERIPEVLRGWVEDRAYVSGINSKGIGGKEYGAIREGKKRRWALARKERRLQAVAF